MTRIAVPNQIIEAAFAAGEANHEERTIPVTWYSGASVLQFSWERGLHNLQLSTDPGHVRLSKLNTGRAPFTNGHRGSNDTDGVIGRILENSATMSGGKGRALVKFAKNDPEADRVWNKITQGILPNVSLEASILKLSEITKEGDELRTFQSTDWEPFAIASVARGADPDAHFKASDTTECEVEFAAHTAPQETAMNANSATQQAAAAAASSATTTTPNPDAAAIRAQALKLNMVGLGEDLIARGTGIHEAREVFLNRVADADLATETRSAHSAFITRDHRDGMVESMSEALACRYTGQKPGDQARQYMGARISDLARQVCLANGVRVDSWEPAQVIRLSMHNTADFPNLLGSTGRRMLQNAYQAAEPAIKKIARRSTSTDFRTKYKLRLSEMPQLLLNNEGAQITTGSVSEAKETYSLSTYARRLQFTRQALINDDLGAFNDIAREFGQSAATLEAQKLVDLLYGAAGVGPTMDDGVALFHANHNNLGSGAIGNTALDAAILALRTQTGLDGVTIIETAPRYLVVPAAKESTAKQYLASITPAVASNVNPHAGTMELVVDPRLDGKSQTAWWIFGDPSVAPVLEYSYLSGAEGLQVDSQAGWDILGVDFRAVLDYGVGAVGTRGCYKSTGV